MSEQAGKLQFHQIWLFIGWCMVAFVIYYSLETGEAPKLNLFFNDKLIHMISYFGLMSWFLQLYKKRLSRWFIAISLVCLGVALEFLQGIGGVRMFEVADMMANTTGVVLGWVFAMLGLDKVLSWFEIRYLVKS